MIGWNNDEHQTNPLPIWATLTEVSDALGISRDLVRAAVRGAFKREELWVKKRDGRLLVDTLSDDYKHQVSQWLKQKEFHALLSGEDADEHAQRALEERCSHDHEASTSPSQITDDWLELCEWLSSQGLSVFYNLLAGDPEVCLQWQWGDLQGEYQYTDIKDAVIDALDCRLSMVPLTEQELLPASESSPSGPQKRGLHFWDFVEKRRSRAFEE